MVAREGEACRREDLILMSPDEKRRCEDRLAAAAEAGAGLADCSADELRHQRPEDRDRCERLRAEAAKAPRQYVDPIPAEKRANYDAVQQAYAEVRKGLPMDWYPQHGNFSGRVPGQAMNINGPLDLKCSFGAGPPSPGSLHLGPSDCRYHPPRGFGVEELGAPRP